MRPAYIRPMPEGFAADAYTMSAIQLKQKYKAGDVVIKRWRGEVGPDPRKNLVAPPPDDFAEKAAVMTQRELKLHYGAGSSTVSRWCKLTSVTPPNGRYQRPHLRRPVPEDFAQLAATMNKTQLQEHYRCFWQVLDRWFAETKIVPSTVRRPCPPRRPSGMNFRPRTTLASDDRQYSVHDQAADVLRHYFPVYRCDDRGRADPKGKLWRVGNSVVDNDELLARADRKRRAA